MRSSLRDSALAGQDGVEGLAGCRCLLHQGGILLRHLVHLPYGIVDLFDPYRLLPTRRRDLGNDVTDLLDTGDDLGEHLYGSSPDLDALFQQQAVERDRSKRQALLHQMQRLMSERVMHAPVFEPATLHGVGPRVAEPAVGLNAQLYFAAPYEEMRLRKP